MTQEVNLYTEAGNTFLADFTIAGDSGAPLNLTSYQVRAALKKDYDSATTTEFIVQIVDAVNGVVRISLSPSQTYALEEGKFYFDCQYFAPNVRTKFIKGILTVYPTVVQPQSLPVSGSTIVKNVTLTFPANTTNTSFSIIDSQVSTLSVVMVQVISFGGNPNLGQNAIVFSTATSDGTLTIFCNALSTPLSGAYQVAYTIYTP